MTTTYDIDRNPIENGVQQVYNDVRESLELILQAELSEQDHALRSALMHTILYSLDDAISNNWDELMRSFWQGVAQDVEAM